MSRCGASDCPSRRKVEGCRYDRNCSPDFGCSTRSPAATERSGEKRSSTVVDPDQPGAGSYRFEPASLALPSGIATDHDLGPKAGDPPHDLVHLAPVPRSNYHHHLDGVLEAPGGSQRIPEQRLSAQIGEHFVVTAPEAIPASSGEDNDGVHSENGGSHLRQWGPDRSLESDVSEEGRALELLDQGRGPAKG